MWIAAISVMSRALFEKWNKFTNKIQREMKLFLYLRVFCAYIHISLLLHRIDVVQLSNVTFETDSCQAQMKFGKHFAEKRGSIRLFRRLKEKKFSEWSSSTQPVYTVTSIYKSLHWLSLQPVCVVQFHYQNCNIFTRSVKRSPSQFKFLFSCICIGK